MIMSDADTINERKKGMRQQGNVSFQKFYVAEHTFQIFIVFTNFNVLYPPRSPASSPIPLSQEKTFKRNEDVMKDFR